MRSDKVNWQKDSNGTTESCDAIIRDGKLVGVIGTAHHRLFYFTTAIARALIELYQPQYVSTLN